MYPSLIYSTVSVSCSKTACTAQELTLHDIGTVTEIHRKFLKQYKSYLYAVLLVFGILVYSAALFTGPKESHLMHLIHAAILFPLVAFPVSRNSVVKDLVFALLLVGLIILAGRVYWYLQDLRSDYEFSFENDYMADAIFVGFSISFVVAQAVRYVIKKIFRV